MTVQVGTYSPDNFAALPSLQTAKALFKSLDAREKLEGPIRELFLSTDIYKRYGVALLHKHFPIQAFQRLVDYNHTATAWTAEDTTSSIFTKYDGIVIPRSYLFDCNGAARPYEFDFVSGVQDIGQVSEEDANFFAHFRSLLNDLGLLNLFGIRDLRAHDDSLSVEVTEDKANIMLPKSMALDDQLIEAMWSFSPSGQQLQKCHCREYCSPYCGQHMADHGCS